MRVSAKLAVLATVLIVVSGCATEFDRRYAAAEHLRAEAAAAGAEWLETGNLLDQANEEAAGGNMDTAFSLLDKAQFQAATAIKQAEHEADAWINRVVR
jgi:hypothetical protein